MTYKHDQLSLSLTVGCLNYAFSPHSFDLSALMLLPSAALHCPGGAQGEDTKQPWHHCHNLQPSSLLQPRRRSTPNHFQVSFRRQDVPGWRYQQND